MSHAGKRCALLADRHLVVSEGIRDILESSFDTVFLVSNSASLKVGAKRLAPALILLDLAMGGENAAKCIRTIRKASPQSRMIVLTSHDQALVASLVLSAGSDSVVLRHCIGRDLLPAVDAVMRGERYASPEFGEVLNTP